MFWKSLISCLRAFISSRKTLHRRHPNLITTCIPCHELFAKEGRTGKKRFVALSFDLFWASVSGDLEWWSIWKLCHPFEKLCHFQKVAGLHSEFVLNSNQQTKCINGKTTASHVASCAQNPRGAMKCGFGKSLHCQVSNPMMETLTLMLNTFHCLFCISNQKPQLHLAFTSELPFRCQSAVPCFLFQTTWMKRSLKETQQWQHQWHQFHTKSLVECSQIALNLCNVVNAIIGARSVTCAWDLTNLHGWLAFHAFKSVNWFLMLAQVQSFEKLGIKHITGIFESSQCFWAPNTHTPWTLRNENPSPFIWTMHPCVATNASNNFFPSAPRWFWELCVFKKHHTRVHEMTNKNAQLAQIEIEADTWNVSFIVNQFFVSLHKQTFGKSRFSNLLGKHSSAFSWPWPCCLFDSVFCGQRRCLLGNFAWKVIVVWWNLLTSAVTTFALHLHIVLGTWFCFACWHFQPIIWCFCVCIAFVVPIKISSHCPSWHVMQSFHTDKSSKSNQHMFHWEFIFTPVEGWQFRLSKLVKSNSTSAETKRVIFGWNINLLPEWLILQTLMQSETLCKGLMGLSLHPVNDFVFESSSSSGSLSSLPLEQCCGLHSSACFQCIFVKKWFDRFGTQEIKPTATNFFRLFSQWNKENDAVGQVVPWETAGRMSWRHMPMPKWIQSWPLTLACTIQACALLCFELCWETFIALCNATRCESYAPLWIVNQWKCMIPGNHKNTMFTPSFIWNDAKFYVWLFYTRTDS